MTDDCKTGLYYGDKKHGDVAASWTRSLNPFDLDESNCGNWKFAEDDGDSFAIDSSQYGQDGKLHGKPCNAALVWCFRSTHIKRDVAGMNLLRLPNGYDKKPGGLVFDGMDDYVDIGRLANFGQSLESFTISFWVRTMDNHASLSSIIKAIDDGDSMVVGVDPNRRVGRADENGAFPTGIQQTKDLDYESGATLVYVRDAQGRVLAGHVRAPYFDNKWHHIQWTVVSAARNTMVNCCTCVFTISTYTIAAENL